jgi:hypothetical protein
MRADGRVDLDIRATIETAAGHRIALSADGVAMPRATEPVADLLENVTLSKAAEEFAWGNTRQVWGVGTVDLRPARFTSLRTCSELRTYSLQRAAKRPSIPDELLTAAECEPF